MQGPVEIRGGQDVPVAAQDGRPLDDVAQFPRVARERVFPEQVERVRGDLRQGLAVLPAEFLEEKVEQLDDVLPRRRRGGIVIFNTSGGRADPAGSAWRRRAVEVDVGRRDDAHVHGGHPVVADAPDLVLLEHAQELLCMFSGISDISSRNSVPLWASSKAPSCRPASSP